MIPFEDFTVGIKYTFIICFITVVVVQAPWTFYFIGKIILNRRRYVGLVQNQDQGDTVKRLTVKYKNEISLHKYLLTSTTFELLTVLLTIVNFVLSANGQTIQFDCSQYYAVLYAYVKYLLELLTILMFVSALEALNLTTRFAKGIYIYSNTNTGLEKKRKRFLVRFVVIACLAVSGVGIGIGFILVEIFLIAQLIQYYKLSTELYRSLQIHYQDTKYEFGINSIEATSVLKYKRHYKWFSLWCFFLALNAIVCVTIFLVSLPQSIIGEDCILELITKQKQPWLNSTVYKGVDFTILGIEGIFYTIFVVLYLPVFVLYTLYYLCDKLLFVRVYKHRYHIRYSMINEEMGQFFV